MIALVIGGMHLIRKLREFYLLFFYTMLAEWLVEIIAFSIMGALILVFSFIFTIASQAFKKRDEEYRKKKEGWDKELRMLKKKKKK